MRVRGTDLVLYIVSDLNRSIPFYRDVLGLELASADEYGFVEFDAPPTTLTLYRPEGPAPITTTLLILAAFLILQVLSLPTVGLTVQETGLFVTTSWWVQPAMSPIQGLTSSFLPSRDLFTI